jgi:hypothetical protein
MIIGHTIAVVVGIALIGAVLISALETVVLPRDGFARITRFVFAVADRLLIHRWRSKDRQANLRALYAPIALTSLPLVWMISVAIGFTFIFWGIGTGSLQDAFEVSGSSLTTLGFSRPEGAARVWLAFIEAIIGLGLVALLISYLPTIYSAHHQREKGMIVLRPFAGTPPTPVDLLINLNRVDALENLELWKTAAGWLLELDQTHSAFPALCYFPDSSPGQSWVASMGTLLDAAALLVSVSDFNRRDHASEMTRGPLLVLAQGVPGVARIARSSELPVDPAPTLTDLLDETSAEPPAQSVLRTEYSDALDRISSFVPAAATADRERGWRRFALIRSTYDRSLRGLAGLTMAPSAEWTTDRPATVGRPRLIVAHPLKVDWKEGSPSPKSQ